MYVSSKDRPADSNHNRFKNQVHIATELGDNINYENNIGTKVKKDKNIVYTIGSSLDYDPKLEKGILYKSVGGTVWKNFEDVMDYWKNSEVRVGDNVVNSNIYEVEADWERDVTKVLGKDYGKLNVKSKIIKKRN